MARFFSHGAFAGLSALCLLLVLAAPAPAGAQAPPPADEALRQRFEALQSATVGLEVRAVEGAASASTLGRQREGTGVVIEPQGLVLTIGYLVLEAERVEITTRGQAKVPGQVVAYDAVTGLGLVKPLFPLAGVQPARLGSAASLAKGTPLLFITGMAPRQAGAVRLMDTRAFTGYWEYHLDSALYTAPPVFNHSGAGLFNAQGELVGVGHLVMRDVMPEDVPEVAPGNLFVPVDVLGPVIDELLRTGANPQARRPWLGVNAMQMDGHVRITRVTEGSAAQAAGLRPGHWVLAVDGETVSTLEAFYKKVWSHRADDGAIRLRVLEGPVTRVIEVPVRERGEAMARPKGV
ncbi:S1C family serine protease [Ramlibacter sp. MAHUQ-53]|uniref:S1C family serine protease n=1 Tax=unclassified Ramlibacter TaxID=2617605 RepID=UPI0036424290